MPLLSSQGLPLSEGVPSPFDTLAADYDDWFDQDGRLIFDIEAAAFQEVISSLPKPWIEIGAGSGRFSETLGVGLGLDPSVKLLERAKCRGLEVCCGVGERLPFCDESFGSAFLILTLCFMNSPFDVLGEVHRILKKDGRLALAMVLRESPWGAFYEKKKASDHPFYRYATFYSFDEITTMLTQIGFSPERYISTLFQKPEAVVVKEAPREGYDSKAGFTLIMAGKEVSEGART